MSAPHDRPTDEARPRPGGDLRVSDADRARVVDDLHHHAAAGRLTLEEFEERVDEAYAAKTRSALRATLRELPLRPGSRSYAMGDTDGAEAFRPRPRAPWAGRGGRGPFGFPWPLVVLAVVVAVVVLTPAPPFPLIPLAVWTTIGLVFWRRRRGVR